jgi:hypothetical protein
MVNLYLVPAFWVARLAFIITIFLIDIGGNSSASRCLRCLSYPSLSLHTRLGTITTTTKAQLIWMHFYLQNESLKQPGRLDIYQIDATGKRQFASSLVCGIHLR